MGKPLNYIKWHKESKNIGQLPQSSTKDIQIHCRHTIFYGSFQSMGKRRTGNCYLKLSLNISDGSKPKGIYLCTGLYTQRTVKCCKFP